MNTMFLQPENEVKVFISHASQDLEFARCFATDLRENGYEAFLDDWSIELGESIPEKISDALEGAHVIIPIISKSFLASSICLDELNSYYLKFRKMKRDAIIPLIIDDSEMPAIYASIKYYRSLNGSDYSDFMSKLMKALKRFG